MVPAERTANRRSRSTSRRMNDATMTSPGKPAMKASHNRTSFIAIVTCFENAGFRRHDHIAQPLIQFGQFSRETHKRLDEHPVHDAVQEPAFQRDKVQQTTG